MVECRFSPAESGQLFRLCGDLLSAGSPREPPRDRDSATGAAAGPAEGQRSTQTGLAFYETTMDANFADNTLKLFINTEIYFVFYI